MPELPAIPEGFRLEQPQQGLPPLPPGFRLENAPPQPAPEERGQLEDIGKSAVRGGAEGTAGLLGLPADVWHYMDRGFQNGVLWAAQKAGLMSPEGAENYRQHATAYQPNELLPTTEHLTNLGSQAAKATGTYISPPQTPAGRYAETIGEFAPSALVGGGAGTATGALKSLAKYAVAPGIGSEMMGELTEGTPAEPYARMAGAVAPFGVEAAANAVRGGARGVGKEISHIPPQQLQDAQALLDQSRAMGNPLSVPQAINQVSNNASRLGDMQRYVEQSKRGAPIMRQFYANQPTQNEALAQQTLAHIANPGANLDDTAANVQRAADRTMSGANAARTQAVNPYYRAAASDQVPHQEMENFLQRLEANIAQDRTGITTPALQRLRDQLIEQPARPATPPQPTGVLGPNGQPVMSAGTPAQPRVPFTDIESLNRIRKQFRDELDQPQWQQQAIPKEAQGLVGRSLEDLQGLMEQHSPAFQRGNQLYQDISENAFNPLKRSPTGQLADTAGWEQQRNLLFNNKPGNERAVTQAIRNISASDPQAAAELVRGHLEELWNNASKAVQSGANQMAGANFAKALSGQQGKNAEAALRALPNGQVAADAMNNMLEIFRAQGKRLAQGSPTQANAEFLRELKGGTDLAPLMAIAHGHGLGMAAGLVNKVWQDFQYGRNTSQLARIFTQGNVDDLRTLATAKTNSIRARAALAALVAKNEQQENPLLGHQP